MNDIASRMDGTMPIKVTWQNTDKTILRYDIWDHWTWSEFEQNTAVARAMVKNASHQTPVACVVVIKNIFSFPPNLIGMSRRYLMTKNNRMVSVIVVCQNVFARALYQVLTKSFSPLADIVELVFSEQEAYTLAKQRLEAVNSVSSNR